jgi:hypothetical protein
MERQESEAKANRSQRPSVVAKQTHGAYGKLESKWIGPFLVTEKTRPGSFYLINTEGDAL